MCSFLQGNNSSSVTIDGTDSNWTITGTLSFLAFIGSNGTGHSTLSITNGGHLKNGNTYLLGAEPSGGGPAIASKVTVFGAGSSWMMTGPLGIGGLGELEIEQGGRVFDQNAFVSSPDVGVQSKVTVNGAGSVWNNLASLAIGQDQGSAEVDVINSAVVTVGTDAHILGGRSNIDTAASASLFVDGSNSSFTATGTIYVGGNAGGTLTVSDGAHVSSASAVVYPKGSNTPGTALVTGSGSNWTTSGDFILDGLLTVSNSGKVNVGGLMIIQDGGELHGDGTVTGNVQNGVLVAPGTSPGRLMIAGNYSQLSTGTLQIELAGINPGTSYDQLSVTGSASVDGKLQVSLLNSFAPKLGDLFDILDWGTLSGTFSTLQLPALGNNLAWDTSQLYTTGVISVTAVPEPAAIALLACGVVTVILIAVNRIRPHPFFAN